MPAVFRGTRQSALLSRTKRHSCSLAHITYPNLMPVCPPPLVPSLPYVRDDFNRCPKPEYGEKCKLLQSPERNHDAFMFPTHDICWETRVYVFSPSSRKADVLQRIRPVVHRCQRQAGFNSLCVIFSLRVANFKTARSRRMPVIHVCSFPHLILM